MRYETAFKREFVTFDISYHRAIKVFINESYFPYTDITDIYVFNIASLFVVVLSYSGFACSNHVDSNILNQAKR